MLGCLDPSKVFQLAGADAIDRTVDAAARETDAHRYDDMSRSQASRLAEARASASAVEVLAEKSAIDPGKFLARYLKKSPISLPRSSQASSLPNSKTRRLIVFSFSSIADG